MVKELIHDHIFLAGLGKMYTADERFKNNVDKYGEGTAEFASQVIVLFCKNNQVDLHEE